MGMIYGGETYIFSKNLQGDVIGIYNENRQLVAKYQYNAFGEITAITDASGNDVSGNANHIANVNPFRYRGYYYDTETGFYYLQTRYYDPVVGRFLNADTFVSTGQGILGNNMFAYCLNNFVNRIDESGCWSFKNIFKAVATVAVAAVVAVAVVAAAPVVASVAAATATAVGAAAIATTASTVATASCVAVAAGTVAIGVNEAIDTVSGYNCGEELLGKETYQAVECVTNTAAMLITMAPQTMPYPSSGRYEPNNLNEQVAMNLSKSAPHTGKVIIPNLSDTKHPGVLGWQKYSQFFPAKDGNIEIHYVGNKYFPCYFDFKFKE